MIPSDYLFEDETESAVTTPSDTYRIDWENKRIRGRVSGLEAVRQFVEKVLRTDKYSYAIYDWYYGNELYNLKGKPFEYITAELPRIIEEALLVDNRILSITDYEFEKIGVDAMTVSFTVNSIYGSINYNNLEVEI